MNDERGTHQDRRRLPRAGRGDGAATDGRVKQATRRKVPAEEKIRIVLEGVRAEVSVAELCRREAIHPTIWYQWLKDLMDAGKARLRGDTKREATSEEVEQLRG